MLNQRIQFLTLIFRRLLCSEKWTLKWRWLWLRIWILSLEINKLSLGIHAVVVVVIISPCNCWFFEWRISDCICEHIFVFEANINWLGLILLLQLWIIDFKIRWLKITCILKQTALQLSCIPSDLLIDLSKLTRIPNLFTFRIIHILGWILPLT